MQWFGNRFKIFGRQRDKRADVPEQIQAASETETKQESDTQERGMKMVIIAGLGNPTKEYENTRHNIGFMAIDALADKYHINVMDCKHKALVGKGVIGGTKVVLVKPLTYMNLSGEAIRAVVDYYKVDAESELIVIYDDISLDVGHNGIKNIIANLKSDTFLRIKIGVGEKPKEYDLVDYVLGHFSKEELEVMRESLEKVDGAVSLMLEDKVDAAMNQYNKKSKGE